MALLLEMPERKIINMRARVTGARAFSCLPQNPFLSKSEMVIYSLEILN
jgi:hypothetical protein